MASIIEYSVYDIPIGIYTIGGACIILFGIIVAIITYLFWKAENKQDLKEG